MRSKNRKLLWSFIALLTVNAAVFFSGRSVGSTLRTDRFAVADTAAIQEVIIVGKGEQNTIQRKGEGWQLNGTFNVDRYLRKILFAVLSEVAVRRELSESETAQLWSEVATKGYEVRWRGQNEGQFYVIGNSKYTRTYFLVDQSEGYEVEIPGYRDYVGGIFQLTSDQWRDRELFRSSFNSLQSVAVDHQEGPDLSLEFKDRFFAVKGITRLDSGSLVNYLNGFELLQANEIVSPKRFARYDSLSRTEPLAIVRVSDIAWNRPFELSIYPKLPGERIHLTTLLDDTMAVIQESKIRQLLARPSDFQAP